MKNLILLVTLLISPSLFALEDSESSPVTNAGVQLDCDTQVDGSVCPVKNASKVSLFDDTSARVNAATPVDTKGAE